MLEVNGWLKLAEEDNWENGCDGSATQFSGSDRFTAETLPELLDRLKGFSGGEDSGVLLNSCGEEGRIDIQVYENAEGIPASQSEMDRFKKGECRVWLATYSFYVEEVSRQSVRLEDDRFDNDGYFMEATNA